LIFLAVFVRPSWPAHSQIAFYIELSGYLFLLTGLAIRIWCICFIGGRKSKQLINQGPYSLCRNPLYVGTFLLVIGAGLCFENLFMLAFCLAVMAPVHVAVVIMEENHLSKLFGEEYQQYKQSVPRFWPRLRNYKSPETITIYTRAIRRIAVDTAFVLLIPEIEDWLEVLHDIDILPVLWHFP
jgi:protein-S-isoprenylcysteine O-methyltransferase Ste14